MSQDYGQTRVDKEGKDYHEYQDLDFYTTDVTESSLWSTSYIAIAIKRYYQDAPCIDIHLTHLYERITGFLEGYFTAFLDHAYDRCLNEVQIYSFRDFVSHKVTDAYGEQSTSLREIENINQWWDGYFNNFFSSADDFRNRKLRLIIDTLFGFEPFKLYEMVLVDCRGKVRKYYDMHLVFLNDKMGINIQVRIIYP